MAKKISKNNMLEVWKIDSLRHTLFLPLYLIFLLLLWHWNYHIAFWIFFGLGVLDYLAIVYKMNKTKRKLFE